MKNIQFGNCKDSGTESPHLFWDACKEVEAILALAYEVIRTLHVKPANMAARVNANFCTATDLADELVKTEGLPFRTAYQIVGSIVRDCHERGFTAKDITRDMLDSQVMAFLGRRLDWSSDQIRDALDASVAVEKRQCIGGPAKGQVIQSIALLRQRLNQDRELHQSRLQRLKESEAIMQADIDNLVGLVD